MLKVDILNDAKKAEQEANNFVEQTKALLLEEGTKESAILAAAGLNKQSVEAVRLRDQKAMRKELKMKSNCEAVLTGGEIKQLCMKYRLRFLKSDNYAGPIDALTGRKINKFMEDIGDPSPKYSARERLYILAPVEAFDFDIAKPIKDPVLFYRHESGLYAVVHKWGNDFTWGRRVVGYLTATALRWRWFMFLSLFSFAAIVCAVLNYLQLPTPAVYIPTVILVIFSVIRMIIGADSGHHSRYKFSEKAWDNSQTTERSMFWM